jgi:ABC-2 type transport system permease protein
MKKSISAVLNIARTELYNLFYSPVAWFVLIVFMFQTALTYTTVLDMFMSRMTMGGPYGKLSNLTSALFNESRGSVFMSVVGILYLVIPLLTMGLMSREVSSGTIKLLYSSPVKLREIVFGKFLAMMIYNLLLLGIVALVALTTIVIVPQADVGMLFSGLLGIYLILGAYSAIGLFTSCLTSYQVVAAIGTFVILALLNFIGTVWQRYDFFRDLTYVFSISNRGLGFIAGLLTTRDLIYFMSIIGMFLAFSIYKLKGTMESTSFLTKAKRYVQVILLVAALGYGTSRPGYIGYLDLTATQKLTLSPKVQTILKRMDGPIDVTMYVNLFSMRGQTMMFGVPGARNNFMSKWENYMRFKPDFNFRFVYFYDTTEANSRMMGMYRGMSLRQVAEKFAKSEKLDLNMFLSPEQLRQQIDLSSEDKRTVMLVKYKGKSTFLRLPDDMDMWPHQGEVAAAFQRLLDAKMPKIGFVEGEGERSIEKMGDKQYKALPNTKGDRYSLVNQGFDVQTVPLKDGNIPKDISTLVIVDPQYYFDSKELSRIQQYIASGGNVMILGETAGQAVLAPLLQPLGVQFKPGFIVQPSKDFAPDFVKFKIRKEAIFLAPGFLKDATDDAFSYVVMPGVSALTYNTNSGFVVKPLLLTDSASWIRKQPLPDDPGAEIRRLQSQVVGMGHNMPAYTDAITYSATDGDEKGSFPTALALSRNINGKQQRIIVASDADFMSNGELMRAYPNTSNFPFSIALFSWVTGGEYPIDYPRIKPKDNKLKLTEGSLGALKLILKIVLPGLLLLFGIVLLIRRKRQ